MVRKSQNEIYVDGSSLADLEISDSPSTRNNLWTFLTQTVPLHPWIAGLAAIVGIVAFGGELSPWVLMIAIAGVTVITVTSTWERSSNERTKTANEPGYVGANARSDRSIEGDTGQRLAVGSDPPVG